MRIFDSVQDRSAGPRWSEADAGIMASHTVLESVQDPDKDPEEDAGQGS
jgi:hypothetical protein